MVCVCRASHALFPFLPTATAVPPSPEAPPTPQLICAGEYEHWHHSVHHGADVQYGQGVGAPVTDCPAIFYPAALTWTAALTHISADLDGPFEHACRFFRAERVVPCVAETRLGGSTVSKDTIATSLFD